MIELMVTVVVVGILAAIAYPSYQNQIRKSRRSAAQSVMLQIAQKEMQLALDIRSYVAAADAAAVAAAPLLVNVDSAVSSAYALSVTATNVANTPPTFVVTAAPQGAQSADSCGTMTINHLGVKTPATGCW